MMLSSRQCLFPHHAASESSHISDELQGCDMPRAWLNLSGSTSRWHLHVRPAPASVVVALNISPVVDHPPRYECMLASQETSNTFPILTTRSSITGARTFSYHSIPFFFLRFARHDFDPSRESTCPRCQRFDRQVPRVLQEAEPPSSCATFHGVKAPPDCRPYW